MIRHILGMLGAALIMCAPATGQVANGGPDMPAGFDIRSNAVRGGEVGEPLSLKITPYNAGRELFSNDRFTVYERINFLDTSLTRYGDAICTVDKPGTKYQRFHSRVVVVFNVAHDERITEDMLWDEVRPVLSDVIHPEICPRANMITAHVYAKNWDRTAAGQIYRPEFAPMPVVQLPPKQKLTDFETSSNLDKRNSVAYDVIQEIVSEGILVAHFQYEVDDYHGCEKPGSMAGCTRETFAPLYWGAPDQMAVWSLNNRMLRERSYGLSSSELEAYKTSLARMRSDYAQYTSFDGYARGFDARMKRNEAARAHNAARREALDDFNEMLKAGWKAIEEKGLSAIISPPGPSGPCDIRVYAGSCIEDVIFVPGYP
ncbi:hypothetical protein [Henriciella aquimarina]|uniref:hypothetical protein n=1 Tax=Henriciella aquimarina TaxID=545261 RepID=UPI000A04478A|nr:hypothetical protein [Henriciella aquimarina]